MPRNNYLINDKNNQINFKFNKNGVISSMNIVILQQNYSPNDLASYITTQVNQLDNTINFICSYNQSNYKITF